MNDREKKISEMLDQATQDVIVPEGLRPENIEKMLQHVTPKETEQQERKQKQTERKDTISTNKKRNHFRTYGLAAAACLLVLAGVFAAARGNLVQLPSREGESTSAGGSAETEQAGAEGSTVREGAIAVARSYDQVHEYLNHYWNDWDQAREEKTKEGFFEKYVSEDGAAAETTEEAASAESSLADSGAGASETQMTTASGSGDYSETNLRTEGVDEADIVKTDGSYLYVLKESAMEIAVVDATKDRMKEVAAIHSQDNGQISEFYVKGKQLFVLSTVARMQVDGSGMEFYNGEGTQLETYDLTDIANPKLSARVSQSGRYRSSRMVGEYLYLFSDFSVGDVRGEVDPHFFVPAVEGELIKESDIFLPSEPSATQYLVVSSIHITEPDQIVDKKAVLSEYGECYVSADNIYIYENCRSASLMRTALGDTDQTVIRKLSYHDGQLEGVAQGKVQGYLNDSFSIDEYEGNLRLVTTISSSTSSKNAVYVLNDVLEIIGKIQNIAKDERVYSARFFGDTGYFVTYRETDPLFSVDFSDPTNPEIIGELKIPGFSEYLHPYGDGLLLGIGMDTDDAGMTNGVKLSMFDISDPSDVKEVQKYTIEDAYYSDVFSDYHAVLIDGTRNMIGFSAYADQEMYYIFSYDQTNGFNREMEEEVNGYSYLGTRGVYIDDRLYVVKGNAIESYRIGTYEKLDDLLV